MRKSSGPLLVLTLILLSTWFAYVIEKRIFMSLAPHWPAIREFMECDTCVRNGSGGTFILALLFVLGVPIALAAVSGYVLFRIELRKIKLPTQGVVISSLLIVLVGGIMVVLGGNGNAGLQILGSVVMLFGTITLFTVGWSSQFSRRLKS